MFKRTTRHSVLGDCSYRYYVNAAAREQHGWRRAGVGRSVNFEWPLCRAAKFSTVVSVDIVFVTLFPTTVEASNCKVHQ